MRRTRLGACALAVLAGLACHDGAAGPARSGSVSLPLAPRFQAGTEGALPVQAIRITAFRIIAEDSSVDELAEVDPIPLAAREVAVDPADVQWDVALDVPVAGGDPLFVEATVELLSGTGAGSPVEWSGRTGPIEVVPGRETPAQSVALGRGGLANLLVGSVTIGQLPALLAVGDAVDAAATLSPAVAGATVSWGALDPTVATVSAAGRIEGIALGAARITATSGLRADTVTISVVSAASSVTSLAIVAGNAQVATVGTAVAVAPRVVARNSRNLPVAGVPIDFAIGAGGGSVGGGARTVTVTAGADGTAAVPTWVLGTTAGAHTLLAGLGNVPPVTFTATATPGAAQNIVVVSGSGQSGTAGQALAQPLVARVRDQFNNPVAGVVVTFASPQQGLFAPVQATSNAQGLVQSTWTPSFSTSTQTATATAAGVATPATFTAGVFIPPR